MNTRLTPLLAVLVFAPVADAEITPLTESQITRLELARDDGDHREEAFHALVENVLQWSDPPGDVAVRLRPDFAALIANPDEHRGALCMISGVIQQQTPIEAPTLDVSEWFVRGDDGTAVAVYLPSDHAEGFRDGQSVEFIARFYKRLTESARDGRPRRYAAFVGALPKRVGSSATPGADMLILIAPIVVMLLVFLWLLIIARRKGRSVQGGRVRGLEYDEPTNPLPEDPADALGELRRAAREDHPPDISAP